MDPGAHRVGAGTASEAVTNLKAASLCGESWSWQPVSGSSPSGTCKLTAGGEFRDFAFKEGELSESFKRTKGEEKKLWPPGGRGQLRTPLSHLTVPFQSSRASAVHSSTNRAPDDTQVRLRGHF